MVSGRYNGDIVVKLEADVVQRRWFAHPVVGSIVGVFAGGISILLVETVAHALLGTPRDAAAITPPMFASVLAAWVTGAGVAGLVGTAWSGARSLVPGTVGGLVLLAGAGVTMIAIPHPGWMIVGAVTLMPAAAWWAARSRVARRM